LARQLLRIVCRPTIRTLDTPPGTWLEFTMQRAKPKKPNLSISALTIFEGAVQESYPEDMKRGYIQQIKRILQDYAQLLKVEGRNKEADELESKASHYQD